MAKHWVYFRDADGDHLVELDFAFDSGAEEPDRNPVIAFGDALARRARQRVEFDRGATRRRR
jgi:hypothetical protein